MERSEQVAHLLTFYGDAVDKPGNLRFGLAADSAGQDSGLVRSEDQVPRSADPEWGRCGGRCESMKRALSTPHLISTPEGSELSKLHCVFVPLTVTLMTWCAVPSLFVAVQR